MADIGQLAKWDFEKEVYIRNEKVIECVLAYLEEHGQRLHPDMMPELEQVARFIFSKVVQAVIYLHEDAKIIHRDIKLDNILFDSELCEVKLSDFTVARGEIEENTHLFDCEGTPCFTAPECTIVEKEGYMPKPTDIWSIGVCIYTFITGIVPFYGDCELQIQINQRQNQLEIPEYFSPILQDLISKLLSKDPSQRPTAYEML